MLSLESPRFIKFTRS